MLHECSSIWIIFRAEMISYSVLPEVGIEFDTRNELEACKYLYE